METTNYPYRVQLECAKIRRAFADKPSYLPLSYWAKKHGLNNEQFSRWDNGRVTPTLIGFIQWRKAAGLYTGHKCLVFASRAQKLDLITYMIFCDTYEIELWS